MSIKFEISLRTKQKVYIIEREYVEPITCSKCNQCINQWHYIIKEEIIDSINVCIENGDVIDRIEYYFEDEGMSMWNKSDNNESFIPDDLFVDKDVAEIELNVKNKEADGE